MNMKLSTRVAAAAALLLCVSFSISLFPTQALAAPASQLAGATTSTTSKTTVSSILLNREQDSTCCEFCSCTENPTYCTVSSGGSCTTECQCTNELSCIDGICKVYTIPGSEEEGGTCFGSAAQVELQDGKVVRMDELVIGDMVKVGKNKYSEVYLFGHRDPHATSRFVELLTENGKKLQLSGSHLVYADNQLIPAKHVQPGHRVTTTTGAEDVIVHARMVSVAGKYNPHTLQGDIVVNEILCSTYTELIHPVLAHMLLGPIRLAYRVLYKNVLGRVLEDGVGAGFKLPWFVSVSNVN